MATIKQKRAFREVLNGSTLVDAMKVAKYADTTASTTGKLTNTKGWKELMNEFLPDSKLAEKHSQLLEDKNHNIQFNALGLAYKIKGYEKDTTPPNQFNFFNLSLDEIRERRRQIITRAMEGTGSVGSSGTLPAGQE